MQHGASPELINYNMYRVECDIITEHCVFILCVVMNIYVVQNNDAVIKC